MDIAELLAKIAEFDEMEAKDGMNIAEAEEEKDTFLDSPIIKSNLLNFGIAVNAYKDDQGIYLGTVSYNTNIKPLSLTDYAGQDAVADVAAIVKKHVEGMEEEIKNLLNLI